MATTTENTYVGDGVTTLYSFTFPYIDVTDVKCAVDGVELTIPTEYIFANATTLQLTTAPATGATIRIFRSTSADDLKAVFYPGSAIRARDLNDNFTQNLYVTQEADRDSTAATKAAEEAAQSAAQAAADAEIAQSAATQAADAEAKADQAIAEVSVATDSAASAAISASAAEAAATQAATDAQTAVDAVDEILDAVEDGAVVSVNGQGGVVSLGLHDLNDVDVSSAGHVPEDGQALVWNNAMGHWMPGDDPTSIVTQDDFAYYPAAEQVTFVGPNTSALTNSSEYHARIPLAGELWVNYLAANNSALTEALSTLTFGDELTLCFYKTDSLGDPQYVEEAGTFSILTENTGSNPLEMWVVFLGPFSTPYPGDYPLVVKSPHLSNGFLPIGDGQTLVYDTTTEKWRPEDVKLSISSLPTLP